MILLAQFELRLGLHTSFLSKARRQVEILRQRHREQVNGQQDLSQKISLGKKGGKCYKTAWQGVSVEEMVDCGGWVIDCSMVQQMSLMNSTRTGS